MLLAVIIAIAFVAAIPLIREKHPGKSAPIEIIQPDFRTLEIREIADLDTVTMYPSGADSYTLKMQNGALQLLKDGQLHDINDLYAEELSEVLTHIVAQETVTDDVSEVADHLSDMGLNPPKAKAHIRYQDGSEATLEVGAAVPNTTYAYYRWSGDKGVYMCDVGIAETFSLTQNHLLPVVQPEVQTSLVTGVRIVNGNGLSRFAFANGARGSLVEPYVYPLSDSAVQSLLTGLQNLRLGTREAEVTEQNRASFGFDQPLCTLEITQQAGSVHQISADGALVSASVPAQSLRFVIGRTEGDYFYTCEYEGSCYFVSRFLLEALVKTDADSLITQTPAAVDADSLAGLVLRTPKGDVEVEVLRSERVLPNNELETDEYGRPVYDTLLLINGQQAASEMLEELCDRLNTLSAAGRIPEDFDLQESDAMRWSLTLENTDGSKRFIEAYRMDAFSDALMVDGVLRHYVHADALDVLMAGLL